MEVIIAAIKLSIDEVLLNTRTTEILEPYAFTGNTGYITDYRVRSFSGNSLELQKKTTYRLSNSFVDNDRELLIYNNHSMCRLTRTARTFEICYGNKEAASSLQLLADLKLLLSDAVISLGGVMLHASGVSYNNSGYLFTGPSGAGKTTIACALKDAFIINDEVMILLPDADGITGHSSPFGSGTYNAHKPFSIPVGRLYNLKKSTRTRMDVSDRRAVVMSVLSGIFTFPTTGRRAEMLMQNVDFLLAHVQCATLYMSLKDINGSAEQIIFGISS
jgi:hypothetical protein